MKLLVTLVATSWLPLSAWAADQQVVDIGVKGLACPFCAYSLEKNLGKLDGVDQVEVHLADNAARIVMSAGRKADLDAIREAILKAGFTPGETKTRVAEE